MTAVSPLCIRPAITNDVEAIVALQKHCYQADFHEVASAFLSKITCADSLCWVAEEEGKLLAYLMSVPTKAGQVPCLNTENYQVPTDADILYLHDMAISPLARGRGIKHQFLDKVFAQAKQYHLGKAVLIAVQDSSPIWEKEGFEIIEARQLGLAETLSSYGHQARLMMKTLTA